MTLGAWRRICARAAIVLLRARAVDANGVANTGRTALFGVRFVGWELLAHPLHPRVG